MFAVLLASVLGIAGVCAVLEYDDEELFENDDTHFHN
tara:strand:- start:710 stop:820 length:111 start_codon:yes stop_codon:yes gene_type:complete